MKKNDSWNFHKINKRNLKIKTKKRWRIVRDTQITVISIGPVVFSIFSHGKQDTTKVAHLNTNLTAFYLNERNFFDWLHFERFSRREKVQIKKFVNISCFAYKITNVCYFEQRQQQQHQQQ